MLIKFDKTPVTADNGNKFVRGIIASGDLHGGRCIVWSDEQEFPLLVDEIVEVEADVRDFVATTGKDGVTRESWVLGDVTVTKALDGEERAEARAAITAAQILAHKARGPRPVGKGTGVATTVAEAGTAPAATAGDQLLRK